MRQVRLTSPGKELWPGITKADYAAYMREIAPAMLPHTKDRPLTMQRFNAGVSGPGFFQKDVGKGTPEWVARVEVGKRDGVVVHPMANDVGTLEWLAQVNALTVHVGLARADKLDKPDRLVLDLDPSADDFDAVRRAALLAGEVLREAGFEPEAMVTGSRGIHVSTRLRRTRTFEQVAALSDALAEELAQRDPGTLTTAFRKAKRGDRIFVDARRNRPAQTVVAAYSPRARPHAPVATPIAWGELEDRRLRPDSWTLRTVLDRLA